MKQPNIRIPVLGAAGRLLAIVFRTADQTARARSVDILVHEVRELDHCFALLVFGAFVGLPMPPGHVSLGLLEVMDKELDLLAQGLVTAHDPLGELFSIFSID